MRGSIGGGWKGSMRHDDKRGDILGIDERSGCGGEELGEMEVRLPVPVQQAQEKWVGQVQAEVVQEEKRPLAQPLLVLTYLFCLTFSLRLIPSVVSNKRKA